MWKVLITSFILIGVYSAVLGQNNYMKMIDDGKHAKAEKKLNKAIEKSPDDIELNYTMAYLYISREFNKYNPEQSYEYLTKAYRKFNQVNDEKIIKQLEKIPINKSKFESLLDTVSRCALEDATAINTIVKYERFLSYFELSPKKYKNSAIERRDVVAYAEASKTNTVESYQSFMNNYPIAKQFRDAEKNRNALAFLNAKKTDNIDAYKYFINKYPNAQEVSQAWYRIHELAYQFAQKQNTSKSYKDFLDAYPYSIQANDANKLYQERQFFENTIQGNYESYFVFTRKFPNNTWVQAATDSIFQIAIDDENILALDFCVKNLNGNKRNTALLLLHDVFTNDGEVATLDNFYSEYDDPIFNDIKTKDYEIAKRGDELMLNLPYNSKDFDKYDEYIKLAAPNERSFVALQRLVSVELKNKNWNSAKQKIQKYESNFGTDNLKYKELIELCDSKFDNSIKTISVGQNVNTTNGGELSPVISADDKTLFFCGKNRKDNIGGEDIFMATKSNNYWGNVSIVSSLSNSNSNDAPLSVSSDGNTILVFKSGKIYYSTKTIYGWSNLEAYPSNINMSDWQSDAMITSDGKSLVFTAIGNKTNNIYIKNPYNYHGDNQYPSDIFVSILSEDGVWSEPINLGKNINTPYSERTPFLHPDMKTLYFSSDGHGGLGKMDVYKSTRLHDTCWNCWSAPVNMGKEFNTPDNDLGYKISTGGDKAYFSYEQKSTKQTSIILLLDVSGSMDGYKLRALKSAAYQTCQSAIMNSAEVAVLAFSGNCKDPIYFTLDFTQDINQITDKISYLYAGGGTPLYEAYQLACEYMWKNSAKSNSNKVILLMTDGDANGCTMLDKTVKNLKSRGILYKTQCIAYDVSSYSLAYSDLKYIANESKGQFYYSESIDELGATFEKAGNDIFSVIDAGGNTDIMVCDIPIHLRPDYVATVSGRLVDADNQPVSADIRWEDLTTGKNVGQSKSDPVDGSFFIVLPLGKIYGYYVDGDEYFPISNNIDLRTSTEPVVIEENIDLVSFKQMIEEGTAVPVNNLFFNFAESSLLPYSLPELQRVAGIIKKNGLKVEISGHTDNIGEEENNQKLSEKRAEAVRDYLINEGCDPSMLQTLGYGESKPVATNDTDVGRAKNRRVELKFVK